MAYRNEAAQASALHKLAELSRSGALNKQSLNQLCRITRYWKVRV